MKAMTLIVLALALGAAGCRSSDDDIRRIVREEMGKGLQKKIIKPVNVIGPYSPAVRVGNFLFVSGQIPIDPETGNMVGGSIEEETRQVLVNLARILHAEGYDSSHVVNATVYLKDINDYAKMNQVYGRYFQEGNYPARVAVQVANLPKQANVEISVVAYK
jgi:2-iminobutanoate/2-iminopropanoate deaminase